MRKIKFRGKSKKTGDWIYGDLITNISNDDSTYIITSKGYIELEKYLDFADTYMELFAYEVIPETVGQYIGRKDRYDEEIYEGDIVRKEIYGKLYYEGIVEWGTAGFVINTKPIGSNYGFKAYIHDPEKIEKLGDKHNNPELLEVK